MSPVPYCVPVVYYLERQYLYDSMNPEPVLQYAWREYQMSALQNENQNENAARINLSIGDTFSITKTISQSDVYLFAGIVEDFSPYHTNFPFVQKQGYDRLLVHGALMFSFSSSLAFHAQTKAGQPALAYGYDHVRFVNPLFVGDTLTSEYKIVRIDDENKKSYAEIKGYNQDGVTVYVCEHILKFLI